MEGLMASRKTTTVAKPAPATTPEAAPAETPCIVAFKGFDATLACRDYQFEIGKTFTMDGPIAACNRGFHACECPLDVWSYYSPVGSRFAEVELSGTVDRHREDSKIAAAVIAIRVEITLPDFIKRAAAWIVEAAKGNLATGDSGHAAATGVSGHAAATGDSGHAAATGDGGHAAATGVSGHAAATGDGGHAAATGDGGHAAATGVSGHAAATGDGGHAAATGVSGHAAATGVSGHAAATGYRGHAAATGVSGHAAATGKNSIAASLGPGGRVKGAAGTWLVAAEYAADGAVTGLVTARVGAPGIEPDTWYRAQGGALVRGEP
jgi:hypothetical protein